MARAPTAESSGDALARAFRVLATPMRVRLLDRLHNPSFGPDLANELGISRQAVAKHLEVLQEAGLVDAHPDKRGFMPALRYEASLTGLFAFKESVLQLAVPQAPDPERRTWLAHTETTAPRPPTPGLLVVHGARRGEWIPLRGGPIWCLGREAVNEVVLAWDPFASARHALLARDGSEWTLTDLSARNRTLVNFHPVPPDRSMGVQDGDAIVVGRTVLVLRT